MIVRTLLLQFFMICWISTIVVAFMDLPPHSNFIFFWILQVICFIIVIYLAFKEPEIDKNAKEVAERAMFCKKENRSQKVKEMFSENERKSLINALFRRAQDETTKDVEGEKEVRAICVKIAFELMNL